MIQPRRVVIVQPYVPSYRVKFFSDLVSALAADGITCVIAAGEPRGAQAARNDSVDAPWIVRTKSRSLRIGGKQLTLGGSRPTWVDADAVIVGHLGSSLDTYLALWDSIRGKRRAAVWGHIKSYVSDAHPLDAALERWQLRRADHVFAYTPGGTEYAQKAGLPADRITTVMNAVDTNSLAAAIEGITPEDVEEFGAAHGLARNHVSAFIGGFDESKRIDFLVEALDELWSLDRTIKILVGGSGVLQDRFDLGVERGQVVMLGYIDDHKKALMGAWAGAILMPGRIGLVAVDALMLGVPIVSTAWPYHAPEAEYLEDGVSRFDAPDDAKAYASYLGAFLSSVRTQESAFSYPTLDIMVENFRAGVLSLVNH